MVKLEGYPIKIVSGDHACDPATVDPLMHLCLAFASCIAKWLRRHYMLRGITEPIYKATISMDFDEKESVSIVFETSFDNFDAGVKMLQTISEECYIGRIITLRKNFTLKCDMYTHTICV